MAFRGIGQPTFKAPDVASDVNALAEISLRSASEILHAVIDDEEIQGHLNGLPMYFDVMIAFAVVCKQNRSMEGIENVSRMSSIAFPMPRNHAYLPCSTFSRTQGINKVC